MIGHVLVFKVKIWVKRRTQWEVLLLDKDETAMSL